ncbi:MAG: Coenzyme F420 hydrogenase/dehydrogenase, beta subunit C-terminal domain, partial [Candidatus Lokiarchaeia archaeon]|nr:Coenzyme F420 hydrogenase/dehydrogenase, beta subunit C-terminal domain [Candidatus Lokiarchaeia archaeon]
FGLFCYLNFSFHDEDRKKLEEKFNFSFEEVESMNVRENLILYFKNGDNLTIPFSELHEIGRPACYGCADFSNIYADISFGGIGSPEKLTTAIVRTKIGEEVYNNALNKGYIKEPLEVNRPNNKMELLAKVSEWSNKKIERAEETLKTK